MKAPKSKTKPKAKQKPVMKQKPKPKRDMPDHLDDSIYPKTFKV